MTAARIPGKPNYKTSLQKSFSDQRNDYEMSRESRFVRRRVGLAPQGGTADYHYRNESQYYRDIEKARDMDRNDAIVGQTIDRAVANIVQDGFTFDPKTGDKKLDNELKARWCEWAENADQCDISGEFTFHDMEQHVMRSMLLDGDIVALGTDASSLQMCEAHCIQTNTRIPNTFLGVTIDQHRRRQKYWIMRDGTTPYKGIEIAQDLPVRDGDGNRQIFHVYNPKRVTQTRGVTAFAPIFQLTGMFEDINFAKLVQQQVVSCFAILREQGFGGSSGDGPPPSTFDYGRPETEATAAGTRYLDGVAPGMEITAPPGQTMKGFSPDVPNPQFFEHVKLMLQLIGVNLGLPLCLVLMDGSETNFSGWRGAVDEARKGFRSNQQNLIKRFHCPVYQWKVRQWMAEDLALRTAAESAKVNIFGHKWNAPTWKYIEPVKDAMGDALKLQNGLTSYRRLHGERGADWDDISTEMIEDSSLAIIKAKKKALAINKKFNDGYPVHWRELISLPMPNGLQMTMQDPNVVREMVESGDRDA